MGLPLPRFAWENPYLTLTLFRNANAVAPEETLAVLSETEQRGWQWLVTVGRSKTREYRNALGVEERTARRHLNHFVKIGLVEKVGAGPATEYKVLQEVDHRPNRAG